MTEEHDYDHEDEAAAEAPAPKQKKAKKEPKPKVVREERNGVTRPAGALTGRVWDKADEISARLGRPALRDEVMAELEAEGMSRGTIATQYARWCTFYGVTKEQRSAVRDSLKQAAAEAEAEAETDEAEAAEPEEVEEDEDE